MPPGLTVRTPMLEIGYAAHGDAAGFPIVAGLVRYDEVASGRINHAIRLTSSAIRDAYIWPARHHATCGVQDIGHLGAQLRHGRILRPTLLEFPDELTDPRPRDLETARHVRLAWPAVIHSGLKPQ